MKSGQKVTALLGMNLFDSLHLLHTSTISLLTKRQRILLVKSQTEFPVSMPAVALHGESESFHDSALKSLFYLLRSALGESVPAKWLHSQRVF